MKKTTNLQSPTAILWVLAPDQKGLVAALANFLLAYDANIVHADQHQDAQNHLFLTRIEWECEGFSLPMEAFQAAFNPVALKYGMQWRVAFSAQKQKIAIMVSQYEHCLADLFHRQRIQELDGEIALVIGNHETCRELVEFNHIPYHYMPINAQTKTEVENQQIDLLKAHGIDLVVLARYMQILSPQFVEAFPNQIINIHHSFLPAFDGAKPYHRAFNRGVKLIGATSHYVTNELDEGPIIEQEVVRISHRDMVEDLIEKGRDLERIVLSRAVRWHLQHRVLSYCNRTVVFD